MSFSSHAREKCGNLTEEHICLSKDLKLLKKDLRDGNLKLKMIMGHKKAQEC